MVASILRADAASEVPSGSVLEAPPNEREGEGSEPPEISVIIPCYNATDTLPAQLDALAQQDCERSWEVIIADNGSTEDLRSVIDTYQGRVPRLRLVDASDVQGAAHARNEGARASKADLLLFTDADDVVATGWIAAMSQALEAHDFVAGALDFERLNPEPTIGSRDVIQQTGLINGDDFPPHAAGNNLGIRREVFVEVGGFDESVMYQQDMDFCWRVQAQGTSLKFVPEALVYVRTRRSLWRAFIQMKRWGTNSVVLKQRHGFPGKAGMELRDLWNVFRGGAPLFVRRLFRVRSRRALFAWAQDLGWFVGILQGMYQTRRGRESRPEPNRDESREAAVESKQ
jgi:cellulose synthase/poly-beta-1,6-N-acetylglucosamine synthase-like glycosyltransferase